MTKPDVEISTNAPWRRSENVVSGNGRAFAIGVARGIVDACAHPLARRTRRHASPNSESLNFKNPVVTCRCCGLTSPGAEPHVSVRALILALARFGISSKEQARALEKAWAEYRKQRRLDIAGKIEGNLQDVCNH